jgi:putative YhgA-like transposase
MPESDSLYHRLFSHPRMVEEIVREFVPDALASGLDFSGLQRVNPKFHTARRIAQYRESDVIWRLPTHEGADIYLYLLIEFQSESDWWMAVRMQVYQGLLWQQIINEQNLKSGARLPPVLLLVLYNGEPRWSAPREISEMIGLAPDSALWHWQPRVRYYLLDMGALVGDDLARRESLVALLFRLEQRQSPQQLEGLVEELIGWFRQHEGFDELKRLFSELVRQVILGLGMELRVPYDLLEMKTMIATLGETWKQEWLAEGEAVGKAKGIAEAVIRLLVKRFGPLPSSLQSRIYSADLQSLESWFDRAINAPDLSAVFDQPH